MPPSQPSVALRNASMARKAIRLAAMLATSMMEDEAPAEAASSKFLSLLKKTKTMKALITN